MLRYVSHCEHTQQSFPTSKTEGGLLRRAVTSSILQLALLSFPSLNQKEELQGCPSAANIGTTDQRAHPDQMETSELRNYQ